MEYIVTFLAVVTVGLYIHHITKKQDKQDKEDEEMVQRAIKSGCPFFTNNPN